MKHATYLSLVVAGAACALLGCAGDDRRETGVPTTSLMGAVIEHDEERVMGLISQGASVNDVTKYGETALMLAAGAYLNQPERDMASGKKPIASRETPAIVELLLANGANPNSENADGRTPLEAAIFHGWLTTVRLLAASGADVNHVNKHGFTPLMYASLRCYEDIASELLRHGADPSIKVVPTGTALDVAIEYKCESVKSLLMPQLEPAKTREKEKGSAR